MLERLVSKLRLLWQSRADPAPKPRHLEAISNHVAAHFGGDGFVMHERVSPTVHIDVHVLPPSGARRHYTLMTSGMSDRDMPMPEGLDDLALIELCLALPEDWPMGPSDDRWGQPEFFWPIKVLKQVARYPHVNKTWLSWGHTIGDPDSPEFLDPGGRFAGLVLLPPATLPEGAESVEAPDGRHIRYLGLIPLRLDELQFKLDHDADALEDKLGRAGVTELIQERRPSVCSR